MSINGATALRKNGRLTPAGQGTTINLRGLEIVCKAVAEDTSRGLTLLEITAPPGSGTPDHVCRFEDKVFYVLDGEFRLRLGAEVVTAKRGDSAIVPRGSVHGFTNAGTTPGRLLVTLTPAGHERFLAGMAKLEARKIESPDKIIDLCDTYGVEFV